MPGFAGLGYFSSQRSTNSSSESNACSSEIKVNQSKSKAQGEPLIPNLAIVIFNSVRVGFT